MKSGKIIFSALLLVTFIQFGTLEAKQRSALKVISSSVTELSIEILPELSSDINENDFREGKLKFIDSEIEERTENGFRNYYHICNVSVPDKNSFRIGKAVFKEINEVRKLKQLKSDSKVFDIIHSGDKEDLSLEYSGLSRYRHIAQLRARVASYNLLTGNLDFNKEISLNIEFSNSGAKSNGIRNLTDDPVTSINHEAGRSWLEIPERNFQPKQKNKDVIQGEVSDNWFKIKINAEGVYRLDASQLSSAGINLSAGDAETIKIYGKSGLNLSEKVSDAQNNLMKEQAIIVKTKSNGELDHILFYANPAWGFVYKNSEFSHQINNYSYDNYYMLTWGGDKGRRAEPLANPDGEPANIPTTYTQRIFFEEEINHAFPYPGSGRYWYGRSVFPWDVTNILHNLDPEGIVKYKFSVAHRSDKSGTFSIKESGQSLINITLSQVNQPYGGSYRSTGNAQVQASKISNERSVLSFNYSSSSGLSATGFLDWYEIHYPRSLKAIDNELSFFTEPDLAGLTEYTMNEFSGSEILGFETTDPENPILLTNKATTGGMYILLTNLTKGNPKKFYISSKIYGAQLERTEMANLRTETTGAEMILVTAPEFLHSAEKYAEYRKEHSNIIVNVVQTTHIFNEFGSGIADPTAIRDYVAFCFTNWTVKPKYLLLWGDGHYDFKNIQYDTRNYIVPFESEYSVYNLSQLDSYTTDDYFVRIIGEDRIGDLSVGRIPIDSEILGEWMVEKIKRYENEMSLDSWRSNIILVADDNLSGDDIDGGSPHTRQSESLSNFVIPEWMSQVKIYLPEYRTEVVPGGKRKYGVTEDMLTEINASGSLMLNWIGHGNPRVWAHEEILERDLIIPKMVNLGKMFFVTAATCDFGRFDMPDKRTGSEEIVFSDKGGAIGAFSATRVVGSDQNARINEYFYKNLLTPDSLSGEYKTLGEVMYAVKLRFFDNNDEKFYLLGDPSMKLLIPEMQARYDKINEVAITDSSDTLKFKALSEIRIEGSIRKINGDIDDSFNGVAIITMLDGDEDIVVEDVNETYHYIKKFGGALNQSSYKVSNGSFTASFIIPKDISYSKNTGRLYLYAYSNDKRTAKTSFRKFIIDGITSAGNEDNKGPEISIYLDDETFLPCELVNSEPLLIVKLKDDSGINTTGNGIGHKIEAWVDDSTGSIDLTRNFKTSVEDSRSGRADRILFGLSPGEHKVRVRAWDVYNNYSEAETCFRTSSTNSYSLEYIDNYPNPMEESTTIRFNHNITPPFDAMLKIYSTAGQMLKSIGARLTTRHTSEIQWDGLDDYGNSVSSGIYIFQIDATSQEGIHTTGVGKISIVK